MLKWAMLANDYDLYVSLYIIFPIVLMFIFAILGSQMKGSKQDDGTVREETSGFGKLMFILMFLVVIGICCIPLIGMFKQ